MPTLLEKGKIIKQRWMSRGTKAKIDTMIGMDFLIEYIKDRVWADRITPPKERLRGIGSKVLVLRSGTGSGKSTLLPPYLYKEFLQERGNLIISQPTKATTTDIPYIILQHNRTLKMGDSIGFQTSSISWKPIRGIIFATYGILLQHLKLMEPDKFMRKYKYIIIDEIHMRTIEIDNCLFYIKKLLTDYWESPDCPFVILTSATFNPKIFMDYFKCPRDHFLDVAGANYPKYIEYPLVNLSDYIMYCVDRTEKIHLDNLSDITNNEFSRDILIFVQGAGQIKMLVEEIHRLNTEVFSKGVEEAKRHLDTVWSKYTGGVENDQYYLLPIASSSSNIQAGGKEYHNLFGDINSINVDIYEFKKGIRTDKIIKTVPASRKVIIGTNAIETGLTIDSLKYCIDTGYVNESSFNPIFGSQMLISKAITQASSEQRMGRIGRTAPGWFYPAYTKNIYNKLQPSSFADIIKENITIFLLDAIISETKTELKVLENRTENSFQISQFDQWWYDLQSENVFDASQVDFIQFPSSDSIIYSLSKLHGLGFIDHEYKPTLYGLYAKGFRRVKIESIRMIMAGYHTGANILDLITIACFLEIGHKLGINKRKYTPRNPLEVSPAESIYYYRMLFCDEFIEFLFIWYDFMELFDKIGDQLERKAIRTNKKQLSIGYIENWAGTNKFNLSGLYEVIMMRDEIIADMLNIGLNPFYNGLELKKGTYNIVNILRKNINEGMEEIRKIKQCIYEGYRFNLCLWNDGLKTYVNYHYHNNINIRSKILQPLLDEQKNSQDIEQIRPQKIITDDCSVMFNPISGQYEFLANYISVMDGFVEVDVEFLNN